MSGDGAVLVPMDDADVGRMAMVQALRTMSDSQKATTETLGKMDDRVRNIEQAVARLEAHDPRVEIKELRKEVSDIVRSCAADTDTLRREIADEWRRRDERIAHLLESSLEDRKQLWIKVGEAAQAAEQAKTLLALAEAQKAKDLKALEEKILQKFLPWTAGGTLLVTLIVTAIVNFVSTRIFHHG